MWSGPLAGTWRRPELNGARTFRAADDGERLQLAYTAPEGLFELTLPKARSYLLGQDTDSTVEEIAEHIAGQVALKRPGQPVQVRAFEGVMKGAIARRG